ncbi:MAG: XdhC family protein, partial [Acidimicrobiales bacterium]|nr:XdhC family protein [Acidimicrobiales bacterium]
DLTPRDHAVVVTRNTDLDVESLVCLLTTDVGSIGVMGSARRWETTCQRLRELGTTPDDLKRVASPIGLELGAENPEEIAVSVMAQIVALDRSTAR